MLQQGIGNGLAAVNSHRTRLRIFWQSLKIFAGNIWVLKKKHHGREMGPSYCSRDDLEREVKNVRAQPSRIDETRIEDRMILLQRRIDDEDDQHQKLTRVQGRDFD